MVKDRPWDRAVKVFITGSLPKGVTVEEAGQRAWNSALKQVTIGEAVVKVEAFHR